MPDKEGLILFVIALAIMLVFFFLMGAFIEYQAHWPYS